MLINKEQIYLLAEQYGLSQNQLAYRTGISRGTLSNALNGRRGVGRKTLVGLLRVFPDQTVASLTIERWVA